MWRGFQFMTKLPERPCDADQLAKLIVDFATGVGPEEHFDEMRGLFVN
jgi:hypothetical protein